MMTHVLSLTFPSPELAGLCTMVEYGDQILTIAVMAILLTAPLGGWNSVSLLPDLGNGNNNPRRNFLNHNIR